MKTIGIKLADGSFYPVLTEGTPQELQLELTTAHNNQTRVMVDLYRSENGSMDDAEYVDTLQIDNLNEHPNGEPDIHFSVSIDENNELSAKIVDSETGATSNVSIELVNRTLEERLADENASSDFSISPTQDFLLSDLNIPDSEEDNPFNETDSGETLPEIDIPVDVPEEQEIIDDETSVSDEDIALDDTPIESDFSENVVEEEPMAEASDNEDSGAGEAVAFAAGAVAGGLLASALNKREENAEENPLEETAEETLPDFDFGDDTATEEAPAEDPLSEITEENPLEETAEETLPDFDFGDDTATTETPAEETLPDFDFGDDTATEEAPAEDPLSEITEENPLEETAEDTLPDFDFGDDTATTETPAEETLPDFDFGDDTATEEAPVEDPLSEITEENPLEETAEGTLPDFDFGDDTATETPAEDPLSEITEENPLEETAEDTLPDFDFGDDTATTETPSEETLPDFDFGDDTATEEAPAEDTLPDFDFGDDTGTDDFFKRSDDAPIDWDTPALDESPSEELASSGGISFTGLYDKETALGDSSVEADEVKKKTRVPVIICIVCAVICVIAVLLMMFFIPSKINLMGKNTAKDEPVVEEVVIEEPEPEPEPVVEIPNPPAKEEEIVVIEKAEEVIPEPPAPPKVEPKEIKYKIRWGDTLWDIADTYYKNPWRYKNIARYNGIKDPDYIISGTTIVIPE